MTTLTLRTSLTRNILLYPLYAKDMINEIVSHLATMLNYPLKRYGDKILALLHVNDMCRFSLNSFSM